MFIRFLLSLYFLILQSTKLWRYASNCHKNIGVRVCKHRFNKEKRLGILSAADRAMQTRATRLTVTQTQSPVLVTSESTANGWLNCRYIDTIIPCHHLGPLRLTQSISPDSLDTSVDDRKGQSGTLFLHIVSPSSSRSSCWSFPCLGCTLCSIEINVAGATEWSQIRKAAWTFIEVYTWIQCLVEFVYSFAAFNNSIAQIYFLDLDNIHLALPLLLCVVL